MLTVQGSDAGAPEGHEADDAMACLVQGLVTYFQEVEGYRAVCRRHEGTAVVREARDGLWVVRCFADGGRACAHLASALRLLSTPDDAAGDHARDESRRWAIAGRSSRSALQAHVSWEGRQALVRARTRQAVLKVEVQILPPAGDLPDLPLRALATALCCHEFLVPDGVAPALPCPPHSGARGDSIREYLTHAMPPKLAARQCI